MVYAYVGLGAGLASMGALLAVLGIGLLMVVGLVWYPALRVWRWLRRAAGQESEHGEVRRATAAAAESPVQAPTQGAAVAVPAAGAEAASDGDPEPAAAPAFSTADKWLHRFAFSATPALKGLADIESRLYRKSIAAAGLDRPVFVAGLPRAGTTMLLQALAATGPFATNCYRDMPFVLTPLLWEWLGRRLPRRAEARERAHGDGVVVSLDTPEALEEVAWRAFWPGKYQTDRIETWQADEQDARGEFAPFLRSHLAKTVAVRRQQGQPAARYLSKNNANLGRVGKLVALLPDAVVIIPFREPRQQAASLLRQHRHFARIHAEDSFARRYMADVGHFEFGANLRPIDFGGWLTRAGQGEGQEEGPWSAAAEHFDFWLRYWCAAYAHALAQSGPNVLFVSYEHACVRPLETLGVLCERAGVGTSDAVAAAAARIEQRQSIAAPTDSDDASPALLDDAAAIYEQLLRRGHI